MDSEGQKLLHANIVNVNWTASGAHVIILVFRAPAYMLPLLSNATAIFLFDAVKQTDSTLHVQSECVMKN